VTTPHLYIVTGTSRGLGLAIAQQLLQRPGTLLLALSRTVHQGLANAPHAASAQLHQWPVDLAAAPAAASRVEIWLNKLGAQTFASATLINNAAMITPPGALEDTPTELLSAALRVGLEAPVLLTGAFLRATRHWPVPRKVLQISSGLGRRAMAAQAPYCALKAGLDHFTRALALEAGAKAHGAQVVSLAPGVIDTGMQVQLRAADPAHFPEHDRFVQLKTRGQLDPPAVAAAKVLAYLDRPDFGRVPVADVRDP
jgi:benzil reductase ((S)-benzoin forming)